MSELDRRSTARRARAAAQMLRTALALSLVTGRPFRIDADPRAPAKKPGLLRQHLTAVQAAARSAARA